MPALQQQQQQQAGGGKGAGAAAPSAQQAKNDDALAGMPAIQLPPGFDPASWRFPDASPAAGRAARANGTGAHHSNGVSAPNQVRKPSTTPLPVMVALCWAHLHLLQHHRERMQQLGAARTPRCSHQHRIIF